MHECHKIGVNLIAKKVDIEVGGYKVGTENYGNNVDIKNPDKFPAGGKKAAYNLYWAACHGQFRKFK